MFCTKKFLPHVHDLNLQLLCLNPLSLISICNCYICHACEGVWMFCTKQFLAHVHDLNLQLLCLNPLPLFPYVTAIFVMLLRVSGCSAPSSFFLMSMT